MTNSVQIPSNWSPRFYQGDLYNNFGHGKRYQRAAAVWHRRAGKDSTVLNLTARDMFKRVGTYWHLFPEQAQARRALWNGIDRDGRRIIDQFLPKEVRARESSQEMLIQAVNGSTWQLAGSDNYDSLVGANPVGVVFTEWSLANPEAWEYIRPILVENGGWALFIYTPRGRNHGYATYHTALKSDDWFAQLLTVDDTGVISPDQIQAERDAGMSEGKIEQEFFCSFEASVEEQFIPGAVVSAAAEREAAHHIGDEKVMGVDVARFGDDETVICFRVGRDARSYPWVTLKGLDTMQVAAKVAEHYAKFEPDALFVDEGGLGAGVVDRLRQLQVTVIPVNAGVAADGLVADVKVANKRMEMWARMRQWLYGAAIWDDSTLKAQLTSQLYDYDNNNAMFLLKKATMKSRHGVPSPDRADALGFTFAYPVVTRAMREAMPDMIPTAPQTAPGGNYNPYRR